MAGGDYVETTWVNGTTPAINAANLNNVENKIGELDEQLRRSKVFAFRDYLKYFADRSFKDIESFDDYTTFTGAGTVSLSDDYTNSIAHRCGLKLRETDSTASYLAAYKTVSMDLTEYNDGSADSDGVIILIFYVSDYTKFQKVTVKFGDSNTDNYSYDATSLSTGFNLISPNRSDFTTNNSPTGWDSITYFRVECLSASGATNEYVVFDFVGMYRPLSGFTFLPNPYVLDDGNNNFDISLIDPFNYSILYFDRSINKIGLQMGDPTTYVDDFHLGCGFQDFICKFDWFVTKANNLSCMTWLYDVNNFAYISIESGTAYLRVDEAGSSSTLDSKALSGTLAKGTEVKVYFEKNGITLRAIFQFEGLETIYLEGETTLSLDGCIYLGGNTTSAYGLLTDFVIGHQQGLKTLKDTNRNRIVIKEQNQTSTTTSMTNDSELYIDIEPYSIYEIELLLYTNSSSADPDFKGNWVFTGDLEIVGQKWVLGHHTTLGTGLPYDSSHFRWVLLNYNSASNYAHDGGSYYIPIQEKAIVKTGPLGGRFQYQWGQNTSSASAIAVKPGSHIKAVKFN